MKRIVIVTFLAAQLFAQNPVVRQGTSPSGDVDFSSARTTKPVRTGGTLPGSCVANELFFLTNVGLQQCVKGKFSPVGNGGTWGTVGGAIAAQTDLWNTLQNKQPLLKGTPSQYVRGDGSLGSLDGTYEPVDPGILRSGGTYVNPSWTRFMTGGTGAVARRVDSKLSDVISVKDFGAVGDGTTDDRASIQAALDTCNGSTWRTISLPAGHYKITSGLSINWSRCNLIGHGILVSYLDYSPSASGTVIKISQGTSVAFDNTLKGFSITSQDTQYVKTAVVASDVSGLTVSNISITGASVNGVNTFHDATNSSVGLQIKGRQLSSIGPVYIIADIPERLSKNPNIPDQSLEDLDHMRFFDQALAAHLNPVILVDDGVYFSNTTFDGYQSWNLGTHGIYRNNTKGTSASYNLKISNVRWEQAESDTGYVIYLGGTTGAIQNLTIDNIGGAGTGATAPMGQDKGTNGVYLRNVWGGLLENFRYIGDKNILSADSTVNNFRLGAIYHPLSNLWDTANFFDFTSVNGRRFGSGVIDQPLDVPFAFKETYGGDPPAPSGACTAPATWYLYANSWSAAPHFMDCLGVARFIAQFPAKGASGNGMKWNADGTLGDLGYIPAPVGDVSVLGTVTKVKGGTVPTSAAVLATNASGQPVASTILTDDGANLKVAGRNLLVLNTVLGNPNQSTDVTTPANPVAGQTAWYSKAGKLCSLSPAGVEGCTGAGGAVSNFWSSGGFTGIGPTSFVPTSTLLVWDSTPAAGVTNAIFRAGPGQDTSTYIWQAQTNAGGPLGGMNTQGKLFSSGGYYVGGLAGANDSAILPNIGVATGWLRGFMFANSANASGTLDAGIYRGGPAIVKIGNGTIGNSSGVLQTATFAPSSTSPSISGCSSATIVGNNHAGVITAGGIACNAVLTFSYTATSGWACQINNRTLQTRTVAQASDTATTATFAGTTVAGDKLNYNCMPY